MSKKSIKNKPNSAINFDKNFEEKDFKQFNNWVANHAAVSNPIKSEDEVLEKKRGKLLKQTVKDVAGEDPIETMLVSQMVSLHHFIELGFVSAGVEMKKSGIITGRYPAMQVTNKMLNTFARQVDVLNGYRGKTSNQKVTVEQVNVESGGNAVVGNIKTGGRGEAANNC